MSHFWGQVQFQQEVEGHISELVEEGEGFDSSSSPDYDSPPERYDEWESECNEWIEASGTFCKWVGLSRPSVLERLEEVMMNAERPPEEEDEDWHDDDYQQPTVFWTIERMFEDL